MYCARKRTIQTLWVLVILNLHQRQKMKLRLVLMLRGKPPVLLTSIFG